MHITESQRKNFFKSFIIREDGCWEWIFYCNKNGYGVIRIGSVTEGTRKTARAHRVSYFIHNGFFDENLDVLHRCDFRKCVNPNHLFLGTNDDNIRDCKEKGRFWNGGSWQQKGDTNGNAKLTNSDVRKIKELLKTHNNTQIASMFSVSHHSISLIRLGKTWTHINI